MPTTNQVKLGAKVRKPLKPHGKPTATEEQHLLVEVQIHNGESLILVFWMLVKYSLMTLKSLKTLTDEPGKSSETPTSLKPLIIGD